MACAVQRRRFPVGASPTRQPLQPEATGAAMEETKWLKPSTAKRMKWMGYLSRATRKHVLCTGSFPFGRLHLDHMRHCGAYGKARSREPLTVSRVELLSARQLSQIRNAG